MTASPTVSIVVPAHDARRTIGMALSSLIAQTFEDWEAIVVDDGSSDGTSNLVRAMGDRRIRCIAQAQSGAAAARNQGLKSARGSYIGFLDADDFLFPEYLHKSLSMLVTSQPRRLVTHNAYFLTAHGINPRLVRHRNSPPRSLERQQDALLRSNFVSIMSVFPRQLLDDVAEFDVSLERAEDWDFWIRASLAGWMFLHQAVPLAFINRTAHSLTSATETVALSEAEILRKIARTHSLTPRQHEQVTARLAAGEPSQLWSDSVAALRTGEYARAAHLHWTATRLATRSPAPLAKALAFRLLPRIVGRIKERQLSRHRPGY